MAAETVGGMAAAMAVETAAADQVAAAAAIDADFSTARLFRPRAPCAIAQSATG
jgi:hypothetical protein